METQRSEVAAARAYLAGITFKIVKAAAARRQRLGEGSGARLPASLAGAPVRLGQVRDQDKPAEVKTPLGYLTARRRLPPLLERLEVTDPRRRAAEMVGQSVERLGAVRGVDWAGGDSKSGASDGGVTTRIKHCARVRMIEALANRWAVDPRHGPRRGAPRVIMAPRRASDKRQDIKALDALLAVCVEGASTYEILRAHGWTAQTFNAKPLARAILGVLDDVADGLGLGRWGEDAEA